MIRTLADTFHTTFKKTLDVNDISLPLGGPFDYETNWTFPHKGHRRGIGVDLRTNSVPDKELKFMLVVWQEKLGGGVLDETQKTLGSGPHYHFMACKSGCGR